MDQDSSENRKRPSSLTRMEVLLAAEREKRGLTGENIPQHKIDESAMSSAPALRADVNMSTAPTAEADRINAIASGKAGYTLSAASLTEVSYAPQKQSLLTWVYNNVKRGGGIPYGDYDEKAAKAQMEKKEFPEYVVPKNAGHFQIFWTKYFVKDSYDAHIKRLSTKASTDGKTPLPHENLGNIFADELYIRPLVKSVDTRMKASGFSEAVYDMQVKMRNLNNTLQNDRSFKFQDFKAGMYAVYNDFANDPKTKQASADFCESLDLILDELRTKRRSKSEHVFDKNGNPYPEDRKAFGAEYDAHGKTGLTVSQIDSAIEYYTDIRERAEKMTAQDSGFLDHYFNDLHKRIGKDILTTKQVSAACLYMRTTLIGYNDDGVVGGSCLGRLGSEVESRLSGKNLFKRVLVDEETLKSNPKLIDKFEFEPARPDQMMSLERQIERSIANPHDRLQEVRLIDPETNAEAVYFKITHQHQDYNGMDVDNWGPEAGMNFTTNLLEVLPSTNHMEMVSRAIDDCANNIGMHTKNTTIPVGYVKPGLDKLLTQAINSNDPFLEFAARKWQKNVDNIFKQSPAPFGFRDTIKKFMTRFKDNYQENTMFAYSQERHISYPLQSLLVKAGSLIGIDHAIKNMTRIGLASSAPDKYKVMKFAHDENFLRPLHYAIGARSIINAKPNPANPLDPNGFAHDSIDFKGIGKDIVLSPIKVLHTVAAPFLYKPDPEKGKMANIWGRATHAFDVAPFYIRGFLQYTTGFADLVNFSKPLNDEKAKASAGRPLAYTVRAAWGASLIAGLVQFGGHALDGNPYEGLREGATTALTVPKMTASAVGYVPANVLRVADLGVNAFAGTGQLIFNTVTGAENKEIHIYSPFNSAADTMSNLGDKIADFYDFRKKSESKQPSAPKKDATPVNIWGEPIENSDKPDSAEKDTSKVKPQENPQEGWPTISRSNTQASVGGSVGVQNLSYSVTASTFNHSSHHDYSTTPVKTKVTYSMGNDTTYEYEQA